MGGRVPGQAGGGAVPRFGVEEEFLVVDPATREIVPAAAAVLTPARERLGDRVGGEITEVQLETRTTPCTTLDELHDELVEARSVLHDAAVEAGVRVLASGTPVLGDMAAPVTRGPRQELGTATFRGLHDELAVCAVHVHVELPERERALMVSNHLRPWLPLLVALTANSPFWNQRDTGYASWRTLMWQRWPVGGPPPYFRSLQHYEDLVGTLLEAGALVDRGTIFWDVRPSLGNPTIEVRVADVPPTAAESALLAALVRGLVTTVLPAVDAGDLGPVVAPELLRLAYWRAARDGLAGDGVDPLTGRLRPAADLARNLLDTVAPALARHGELERVEGWLRRLVEGGTGATRQRAAAARDGRLTDVVDRLAAEVAPVGLAALERQESKRA